MQLLERRKHDLIRTLGDLSPAEFALVVGTLSPPAGILPSEVAPQLQRAASLVEWAERTAPGLTSLQEVLYAVMDKEMPAQDVICPYKGLSYFDCNDEDYKYFYGREALIEKLLEEIDHSNFVVIVGASGSGKSSVLRAGLLQTLKHRKTEEIRIFVPGEHPLRNLAMAFVDKELRRTKQAQQQREAESLIQDGAEGLRCLVQTFRNRRVVLVIDQFEEAFTLCQDPTERQQFFATVLNALAAIPSQLCLILAMRSDFVGKCFEQNYSGLAEKVESNLKSIQPMSYEELRVAIIEPARQAGLTLESGLVDTLIEDVEQSPGRLPLLQYTLTELWKQREGNQLKLSTYSQLGGVAGTLQQRADEIFASLTPEQQQTARHIFLNLTQLGEGAEDTRRRVSQKSLLSSRHRTRRVDTVIKALADANLLVTSEEDTAKGGKRVATIEVAHEALIRNWPQLRKWLDEDRDLLRQQRKIEADAQEWVENQKQNSFLLKGSKLVAAKSIFANSAHKVSLSKQAEVFLQKSVRSHRIWKRIRRAVFGAAVATSAGLLASFVIVGQSSRSRVLAETASTLLNFREINALNEALTAANIQTQIGWVNSLPRWIPGISLIADNHFKVNAVLQDAVYGIRQKNILSHDSVVLSVDVSSNQSIIASADASGEIRLWTLEGTLLNTINAHSDENANKAPSTSSDKGDNKALSISVAFDTDGNQLVSSSKDGTIKLWDVEREAEAINLKFNKMIAEDESPVHRALFVPNQERIVSAHKDGNLKFWTLEGKPIKTIQAEQGSLYDIDIKPDGSLIASAGDTLLDKDGKKYGSIKFWDLDGKFVKGFRAESCNDKSCIVFGVSFSHNGDYLASASDNGQVHLWDLDGNYIERIGKYEEEVTELTFGPKIDAEEEGLKYVDTLAAVTRDGLVRVWFKERDQDFKTEADLTLPGHDLGVNQVSFTADGQTLVTASDDLTVQLWHSTKKTLNPVDKLWHGNVETASSSLHTDGKKFVTAGDSGEIILWHLDADGIWEPIKRVEHHQGRIRDISFSPDGETVTSAGENGTIKLWSANLTLQNELNKDMPEEDRAVISGISYDPNGVIASADEGGKVNLWNPGDTAPITLEDDEDVYFYAVAFNPKGTLLAAAGHNGVGKDGVIRLWKKSGEDWTPTQTLDDVSRIYSLVFSPNGELLVSGSRDGVVKIWQPNGKLKKTLYDHQGSIEDISFSPNGRVFATAGTDQKVVIWSRDGNKLDENRDHLHGLEDVEFGLDGRSLISTSRDGEASIRDINLKSLMDSGCSLSENYLETSPSAPSNSVCALTNIFTSWFGNDIKE